MEDVIYGEHVDKLVCFSLSQTKQCSDNTILKQDWMPPKIHKTVNFQKSFMKSFLLK